ncbi:hypothetical protein AGMMS49574_10380 [Bacteroidia bacterium]|nr:hypothetical protein AGMMS49574_10380 [Bacteroidia bacterium]
MKNKNRLIGILFVAAITLLPASPTGAQVANVDSLEQVLRTGKLSNDERLQLYYDLGDEYRNKDIKVSIAYRREGLALARKVKNRQMQMRFFHKMGDACQVEHKLDSALYFYEQSLHLAQELGNVKQENLVSMQMGLAYQLKGMYSKALQYFMEALSYFEQSEDEADKGVKGTLFFYIGGIHLEILNLEQSLLYLSKAESLFRETGHKIGLASTIMLIAQILPEVRGEAMLEDKAAMEELVASVREALELLKEVDDRSTQVSVYAALGNLYLKMRDYTNAQACIDSGFQLIEVVGSLPIYIYELYNIQSAVYYKQGKYAECEEVALKSLAIDTTHIPVMFDMMTHIILSNIKMGKAERAEEYFTKYWTQIKDYMTAEHQKNISEMEVKYETEKKELRIAALEKERALYFWLSLAAAVILLLALLAMFLWIKWAKKERQLVATQSVLDGEIAERTRLARDLHDGLGGMLSVVKLNLEEIKNGVPTEDVERYDYVLTPLNDSINELHRVTHNMMPDSLARSGLKMSLTDFCHSIPGVDFQYLGAADRLDPKLEVMIYRTVHELVNNALRHADATHILVQIIRENSRLSLVVQDDGQGFDPKAITSGMGLKNIRHRVAANNGHLEISSETGKGTEISMDFKL